MEGGVEIPMQQVVGEEIQFAEQIIQEEVMDVTQIVQEEVTNRKITHFMTWQRLKYMQIVHVSFQIILYKKR